MRALLLLFVLAPLFAHADTGLAMKCDSATAPTQAAACTGPRTWMHPVAGDTGAYLSYPTVVADSTTVGWNDAKLQFIPWIAIPGNAGVLTCAKNISAPSAIPVGGADACAPGGDPVAKVFVAASTVPLTPPIALQNATANLAWTPLTVMLDGTSLTDLTGYNFYQGNSPTTLVKVAQLAPGATSYIVNGLAAGTYYFALSGTSASKGEGDKAFSVGVTVAREAVPGKPGLFKLSVTFSQ